ncbi:peptide deformylase [Ruminococcus sp. Marseille-P6503]|uniref:peptide deformylase n=1 Tax=Ruminococcus sp. Marseille-P6503 TaxID=2364796 RepID=UPI000F51E78A|nr:peptide deformylase [Ruminococcus sp. Marseille-P6503]
MAIRNILNKRDETLHKMCKPVEKFDEKLWTLLDDMAETLKKAEGAGLAAPQVGILRRAVVIDAGEGLCELINPQILEESEEKHKVIEGCLSCPGEWGYTVRPVRVKFRAQDRNGNWYEKEVSDLFAQAVCHETEHLDGHLFLEKVVEFVDVDEK